MSWLFSQALVEEYSAENCLDGAVERDAYAAGILAQRQNDGCLEPFPIWSDVTSFDGKPWRGVAEIVSGGFPCQDISAAGKGAGIEGSRSGLWKQFKRIVGEVRPRFVYVENSPMLTIRGLGVVLGDLAEMGFDAEWGVLGTSSVGGNCEGERFWLVAEATESGWAKMVCGKTGVSEEKSYRWSSVDAYPHRRIDRIRKLESLACQPAILGSNDGLAYRMDRLHCTGNGQHPWVAATAFTLLRERLEND